MKIVELRFENLNSLVGSWQIDLDQPEFVSDGIFAITGPTGAGKTTILDAICLALYGSTPRLGRLGKGTNELMSRQTGQCFAQVTFETRTGRYISQWSQHRARKKSDGDLQAPRHEISDASSGKILSSSVKESGNLIVELTGMSFEQFTRSMMLAQGAFAAFLQAKSDERAPILEQITGSEIYSEISILVHQHRGEQDNRLQVLKQQLAGRPVLSAEQRLELQQQFDTLQRQVQGLQQEQNTVRAQLLTLQQLAANAEQRQRHDAKQQAYQQRDIDFEPNRQRLRLAQRTLGIAADYRALVLARTEHQAEQDRLLTVAQQQPASQARLETAQREWAAQSQHWEQQRATLERMQPVLEQTRALDALLNQRREALRVQQANRDEILSHQQRLQTQHERLVQQRDVARQTLEMVQSKAQHARADATLPTAWSGLMQGLDTWLDIDLQMVQLAKTQRERAAELAQAQSSHETLKARLQTLEEQHQQSQVAMQQQQQALNMALDGRVLTDWQQHHSQLLARQQQCQQATDNWRQMLSVTEAIAADQQALQDWQQQARQLDQAVQQLQHELSLQQTLRESLRQQEGLQRRIETYEQARAHLHDGQPCPLCGALEHPFAQGVTASVDQLQQQMMQCQQTMTKLEQALSAQRLERGKAGFQIEALERRLFAAQTTLQACQQAQPALLDVLGVTLIPVNQTIGSVLEQLQAQLGSQAQQVQQQLQTLGEHSASLQQALQAMQQSAAVLQQQQNLWQSTQQKYEQIRQQAVQAQQGFEQQSLRRIAVADKLIPLLAEYGVQSDIFEHRAQVQATQDLLTQRRDHWVQLQADLLQAQQVLPTLEQSVQHVQEQLNAQREALQQLAGTQAQLQKQIQQGQQQREALLQTDNPVEVGHRLAAAVEHARVSLEQSRERLNQAQMAHQQLLDRYATLQATIAQRQQRLDQSEQTLQAWLSEHGFADEAALQAAMLSEPQRQQLEAQERQLLDEKSALAAEKTTLLSEQARLSAMASASHSVETLAQQLHEVEQRAHQATEMLGSVRQRLSDDDQARQASVSLWERVEQQQQILTQWNTLHALIGSADGKKFRTFAQGLTFEVVIQHANRQLQRMTDRYVLVRGTSEPLELNVIDQYQAAEVRTTKNLSGGESFLVSLALALGLSNMASRKIRVDSLFLDEGFGTLDEDALDLALQTLSSLHQEGKLIGVISHVQALKDRIATQIQVTPTRGGRSVLHGPGCTQGVAEVA